MGTISDETLMNLVMHWWPFAHHFFVFILEVDLGSMDVNHGPNPGFNLGCKFSILFAIYICFKCFRVVPGKDFNTLI